jgi:hypothetical protein
MATLPSVDEILGPPPLPTVDQLLGPAPTQTPEWGALSGFERQVGQPLETGVALLGQEFGVGGAVGGQERLNRLTQVDALMRQGGPDAAVGFAKQFDDPVLMQYIGASARGDVAERQRLRAETEAFARMGREQIQWGLELVRWGWRMLRPFSTSFARREWICRILKRSGRR